MHLAPYHMSYFGFPQNLTLRQKHSYKKSIWQRSQGPHCVEWGEWSRNKEKVNKGCIAEWVTDMDSRGSVLLGAIWETGVCEGKMSACMATVHLCFRWLSNIMDMVWGTGRIFCSLIEIAYIIEYYTAEKYQGLLENEN